MLLATITGLAVMMAAGTWLWVRLLRQHGLTLNRLEAIERELVLYRLAAGDRRTDPFTGERSGETGERSGEAGSLAKSKINRNGLPAGTPAPAFELALADGSGTVSLAHYAGRPLLLVLISAGCSPCDQLLVKLESLDASHMTDAVLIVGVGNRADLRAKLARHSLTCAVVVQNGWDLSRLYGTFRFPSAFVIDPDGRIAVERAEGVDEIWKVAQTVFCVSNLRRTEISIPAFSMGVEA